MFARKYINMILAGAAGSDAISVLRSNATIAAEWELEASGLVQTTGTCNGASGNQLCDANRDETHRVCAKLVQPNGDKVKWGANHDKDFWQLTGQPDWSSKVGAGGEWCICKWALATLINNVGCDAVKDGIDCGATDLHDVMCSYDDHGTHGNVKLAPAHDCLVTACGQAATDAKHNCPQQSSQQSSEQ